MFNVSISNNLICFRFLSLVLDQMDTCFCNAAGAVSVLLGMLSRLACFAVRERFACKEILDKHERSLWLVAGHLVAGSSHGDQAQAALLLALVLHNVATHLSGALKSSVSSYYHNIEIITTKCKQSYIIQTKNVCIVLMFALILQ
jgi:hypothetical protein